MHVIVLGRVAVETDTATVKARRLGFDEAITKNEKQLIHVVVPAI